MKRTTERTTKRTTFSRIVIGAALSAALVPGTALAASGSYLATSGDGLHGADAGEEARESDMAWENADADASANADAVANEHESADAVANVSIGAIVNADADAEADTAANDNLSRLLASVQDDVASQKSEARASLAAYKIMAAVQTAATEPTDKVLAYDPADIQTIGTQASTGHSICCPSFSCAYADAVLDGTVHDHSYYVCSCCMWTDWGGGNSAYRSVGTDEQLLREAYDQIAAGKPTVIHVAASYGEHWIALIGYQNATDPDHLTLANFIALDPWDGAQITASDRFSLYGDGCEHISEREVWF